MYCSLFLSFFATDHFTECLVPNHNLVTSEELRGRSKKCLYDKIQSNWDLDMKYKKADQQIPTNYFGA